MKRFILLRRMSQASFLFFFLCILWSVKYPLKSAPLPSMLFSVDPLIASVVSVSGRAVLAGTAFSVLMIILTLILGRFFCGWVCPLGSTIDMVGALRKNATFNNVSGGRLRALKFIILGVILFFSFTGVQVAWVLDPMVIMARFISLNLVPAVTQLADKFFIFMVNISGFYGPLIDFYRALKASILKIHNPYFSYSYIMLAFFLLVVGSSLFLKRLWCRAVCPLGALYALAAHFSLLSMTPDKCAECGTCSVKCRMGAVKSDLTYVKRECVLCMDCIYDCAHHAVKFMWPSLSRPRKEPGNSDSRGGISRRNFLFFLLASATFHAGFKNNRTRTVNGPYVNIIRPPAALKEEKFLDRCIRCGSCMKVCVTNGLQPVLFQGGFSGIWTPELIPEIGYCEYNCTLCGSVCPTGAIPNLTPREKKKVRLGTAKVDRTLCFSWAQKRECIVCEEHCPVPGKAVKLINEEYGNKIISKPYVDVSLCIGCGICQNKCPARPERAIKVYSINAFRS